LGSYLTHHIVDTIFPYQWSGLYFQPRHLRSQIKFEFIRHGPLNPDSVLQSSNCKSVAVLDEGISDKLQKTIINKPVIIFPDFTDESKPDMTFPLIKEIEEKAEGRKIVGLLGSLAKRKGFLKLLEIAQLSLEENSFFIFIGKLDKQSFSTEELDKINSFIESKPQNCLFHLERIPNESQFNALIKICDILFALYNYPHSSNILTKAAIFEKPVISIDNFCMGERVSKYRLGLTISNNSTEQCVDSIHKLAVLSEQSQFYLNPNFVDYKNIHSVEQLIVKFSEILSTHS
ncbi:MAG: glycosyltransferase, partial [Cyanobacteriota bacterium]|nr:glycosyltransferase [Cyanobacteriota bacterium]